eukprot:snap_masked-scaffold_13-processed-gene-11.51-mRNA-1 protein AED:1.00 eAED:1.00 QI:0/-1/0/0/-1/1/1/0/877
MKKYRRQRSKITDADGYESSMASLSEDEDEIKRKTTGSMTEYPTQHQAKSSSARREEFALQGRSQTTVVERIRSYIPFNLGNSQKKRMTQADPPAEDKDRKKPSDFDAAHINPKTVLNVKNNAPNKEELTNAIEKYESTYIKNNKLVEYIKGFKDLDNILNVFFFEFLRLRRSSLQCSRLWVSAMRTRFLFICAVGFLLERRRFAKPEYKKLRLTELFDYVSKLRHSIAKCTQFLATFNLHSDLPKEENHNAMTRRQIARKQKYSPKKLKTVRLFQKNTSQDNNDKRVLKYWQWHFLRARFLTNLAKDLEKENKGLCNRYVDFLIHAYEIQEETAMAFRDHLDLKVVEATEWLYENEFLAQRGEYNRKILAQVAQGAQCVDDKIKVEKTKVSTNHSFENIQKDEWEVHRYYKLREWYYVCRDTWGLRLESRRLDPNYKTSPNAFMAEFCASMDGEDLGSSQETIEEDIRKSSKTLTRRKRKKPRLTVVEKGRGIAHVVRYSDEDQVAREILHKTKHLLQDLAKSNPEMKTDDEIYEYQQGLRTLGPFSLVPLQEPRDYFDFIFNKVKNCITYKLKNEIAKSLPGLEWAAGRVGVSSPLSPISLPDGNIPVGATEKEVLKASKIHAEARFYRFLYPLDIDNNSKTTGSFKICKEFAKSRSSPIHLFLLNGAFAYYRESEAYEKNTEQIDAPVEINGITMGDDLFFDGPYKANPSNDDIKGEVASEDFRKEIKNKGLELRNVTLEPLLNEGCEKFIFIPNEKEKKQPDYRRIIMTEANEAGIKDSIHKWHFKGAFAYLYQENTKEDRTEDENTEKERFRVSDPNYFSVTSFKSITAKIAENNNTPIIDKLNRIEREFKKAWEETSHEKLETYRSNWNNE